MKTSQQLDEVMNHFQKAEKVYIDLETEGLAPMGHVFSDTEKKISKLPKGAKVAIIGASTPETGIWEALKCIEESKEHIIINSARTYGKTHFLRNLAISMAMAQTVNKTVEIEIEESPEQIYDRIKRNVLSTAQKSFFPQPKPLKESYKERFRRLALKQYHENKARKKYRHVLTGNIHVDNSTDIESFFNFLDTLRRTKEEG